MKRKRMGETIIKFITIFALLVPCCILVLLVGEWVYAEVRFQIWLRQDERRLDFSAYDHPEELKEALLAKLPLGSSEEAVQAFIMTHGWPYKSPEESFYGPAAFGILMVEDRAGRGLFGLRRILFTTNNIWGITFELDPVDHNLVDIHVSLSSGK